MHYLIQVNLYLIIFFAFYFLLLKKETFYQANRFFLMIGGIISFVIPFMQTSWVKSWFVTQEVAHFMVAYDAGVFNEPITAVSAFGKTSMTEILHGLYVIGLIVFTLRFGWRVIKTLSFIKGFEPESESAVSFFGMIRVGKPLNKYKAVHDHEKVHVKQNHSFDIILFEVIAILCWINPLVYILKREIKLLHEYQADKFASENSESKAYYAALLLSRKFGVSPESLLSNSFFTKSFLKARMEMLGKEESEDRALLKYGLIAPVFLGMMVFASASIAKSEGIKDIEKYTDKVMFTPPKILKEVSIDLSEYQNGGFIKSIDDEADLSLKEELPPPPPRVENPSKLSKVEVFAEVVETPGTLDSKPNEEEVVFVGVEESPSYPGGEKVMYKFLGENIDYPKSASKANVTGRVTVQFVIEKDGSIEHVKVLKGIGFGCDEEAQRVVKSMPKWKPGIQNGRSVRVYYTIPIMFVLE